MKTKLDINKKQLIVIGTLIVIGLIAAVLIIGMPKSQPAGGHGHGEEDGHAHAEGKKDEHGDEHGHAHGGDEHGAHEEAQAKGPHGGNLFKEGDFSIEIALAEDGGEPRFKAWMFDKDKPLPPSAGTLSITLTRPDGKQQEVGFSADKEGLRSTSVIAEPHIFEATVTVQTPKEPYLFAFQQTEGKVAMSDAQIKAAGVTLDTASGARIVSSLQLPGEIRFNEDRTAHVVPRLSGVVERVAVNLGQQVKKGQVLAVIASSDLSEQRSELLAAQKRLELARTTHDREKKLWEEKISAEQDYLQAQQALREAEIAAANARQKLATLGATVGGPGSLSSYELRAPFDGMIVEKHIALGESVQGDTKVFTLSDLSTVWAEFSVPAKDLNQVRVGEKATVRSTAFESKASGSVTYVGALLGEQTRAAQGRVTLANPQLAWRPGLFVTVELISAETDVPVSVSPHALQTHEDKTVIFMRVPGGFIPQPVTVGRSDGKRVEIVSGLQPNAQYAAQGSFVVKSELGKSTAEHVH